jgi:hypothetical protein
MNITSKGEVKTNDMSTFFINYLMNYSGFDESILNMNLGVQVSCLQMQNMSTLQKNRGGGCLNPKKYKKLPNGKL